MKNGKYDRNRIGADVSDEKVAMLGIFVSTPKRSVANTLQDG